jgi:hypothetical protein
MASNEPVAAESRAQLIERLLECARHYVAIFYPQTADEQSERDELLEQINSALPPVAEPPFVVCAGAYCCLADGHEGACDDVPW